MTTIAETKWGETPSLAPQGFCASSPFLTLSRRPVREKDEKIGKGKRKNRGRGKLVPSYLVPTHAKKCQPTFCCGSLGCSVHPTPPLSQRRVPVDQ